MQAHDLAGLSPQDTELLQSGLSSWSSWAEQPPTVIGELGAGLTNRSYLLGVAEQRYVLRINTAQSDALDLQRSVELAVLRRAVDAGISPALLYADPQARFLVSAFVDAVPWRREQSGTDAGVKQLAGLLQAIHQLAPLAAALDAAALDIQAKVEHYWRFMDGSSELAVQLRRLQPEFQRHLQAALAGNSRPCLCHNDLLPDNILMSQTTRLTAIDWEYAAMGDAYFDLAVVVEGHGLNDSQTEALLAAYLGRAVTATDNERLCHARVLYCYVSLLWYGVKYPRPGSAIAAAISSLLVRCRALLRQFQSGVLAP